ncbi:MAG: PQQ-binding-like beta-propeller repeat protein [Chloroflexi bacterium]|nr:PQQ-binding-like beta-propeller repeat protein [Chloroflexota bacterium]
MRPRLPPAIPLALLLGLILLLTGACLGRGPTLRPGWAGVAFSQDRVFVGTQEGRVVALDKATGSYQASYPPEGTPPLPAVYGGPTVHGDRVYVGGYNGKVYALRADDLSLIWQFPPDARTLGPVVGGLTVADGLLLFGASDGYLRALDVESGEERWRYPTQDKVWSTPTVQGDTVYFGAMDHGVYAVSITTGEPRWEEPFRAGGAVAGAPVVAQGKVLVGSFDRNFYALDAVTGKELWRFRGDNWFWAGAAADATRVYAISMSGTLYALDLAGNLLRQEKLGLGGPALAPPLLLDSLLVVTSDEGWVYVMDPPTLQQKPPGYNLGARVRGTIAVDQGTIYVNTSAKDQGVWALRLTGKQEKLWGPVPPRPKER